MAPQGLIQSHNRPLKKIKNVSHTLNQTLGPPRSLTTCLSEVSTGAQIKKGCCRCGFCLAEWTTVRFIRGLQSFERILSAKTMPI